MIVFPQIFKSSEEEMNAQLRGYGLVISTIFNITPNCKHLKVAGQETIGTRFLLECIVSIKVTALSLLWLFCPENSKNVNCLRLREVSLYKLLNFQPFSRKQFFSRKLIVVPPFIPN